jgi:hypothetical protein
MLAATLIVRESAVSRRSGASFARDSEFIRGHPPDKVGFMFLDASMESPKNQIAS